eukprot:COSAG02_NODE_34736_length_479_cov_0.671053_1_plen_67_part_10
MAKAAAHGALDAGPALAAGVELDRAGRGLGPAARLGAAQVPAQGVDRRAEGYNRYRSALPALATNIC